MAIKITKVNEWYLRNGLPREIKAIEVHILDTNYYRKFFVDEYEDFRLLFQLFGNWIIDDTEDYGKLLEMTVFEDESRYGDAEFEYNAVDEGEKSEEKGISLIKEVINELNISRESLSRFLGGDEEFISRVEKGEDNLTSTMFDSLRYLSTYSFSFPENLTLEEIESVVAIGRVVHNIREMNDILQEIKSDC